MKVKELIEDLKEFDPELRVKLAQSPLSCMEILSIYESRDSHGYNYLCIDVQEEEE